MFQQGVRVTARVGCTLAQLLRDEFGLDAAYVAQRITTIFLNSSPVDDVHRATITDGATIALSGAMPGLVGATMRSGGYYAAMRGAITHRESTEVGAERDGTIRLKLFNLLLPELGPAFLRHGVILSAAQLSDLFNSMDNAFWQGCRVRLDGSQMAPDRLLNACAHGDVLLRVEIAA
jgi:hypothetical protein